MRKYGLIALAILLVASIVPVLNAQSTGATRVSSTNTSTQGGGGVSAGTANTWTAAQTFNDGIQLIFGTGSDSSVEYNTTLTPDSLFLGVSTDSNAFHIGQIGDRGFDLNNGPCGTSACTNPTLIIHSANQATDEYLGLSHNQSTVQFDTEAGGAYDFYITTGNEARISNTLFRVPSNNFIGFSSSTDNSTTIDTGLDRVSAGVLRAVSSTSGTIAAFMSSKAIEAVTTTKTPGNGESGECYTNTGDTDGVAFTLPNDPTAGVTYCFVVTASVGGGEFGIAPNTGETLQYGSDACAVDITATAVGASITIMAATGGSGAIWVTTSHAVAADWTCNDA